MSNTVSSSTAIPSAVPKRRYAALVAYLLMIAAAFGAFAGIRWLGQGLEKPVPVSVAAVAEHAAKVDVVFHVLATLAAIIMLGYLIGGVLKYFGQPPVIGEVMAGLVLGPSVLGALSPQVAELLVPGPADDPSGVVVSALTAVSRLGVVLYMFLVGLELNLPQLRNKAHAAVMISHASIVLPFVLGAVLALFLFPTLSTGKTDFTSFALFMGVAMAITAFPVLARILTDQKLDKTELGVVALSCAATDDVTAWCLLALAIGIAEAQISNALTVLGGAAAYLLVMFVFVRPLASRGLRRFGGEFPSWIVPVVLVAIMLSALTTKVIGIHSLFGGFAMGVVLSSNEGLAKMLREKFHDLATILLLPAFFAITGLRTEVGLLGSASDWLIAGLIILVATVGKVGGTVAAARFTGLGWRDSSALGWLMNTRGLMELIALNIGLEIGIISPRLFAMMVLMALVTTLATAPIVRWILQPEGVPGERYANT